MMEAKSVSGKEEEEESEDESGEEDNEVDEENEERAKKDGPWYAPFYKVMVCSHRCCTDQPKEGCEGECCTVKEKRSKMKKVAKRSPRLAKLPAVMTSDLLH